MNDQTSFTYSTLNEGEDFYLVDRWGNNLHFKILTFPAPSGWVSEAVEIPNQNSETEPRVF